jgi:hypothetical protein
LVELLKKNDLIEGGDSYLEIYINDILKVWGTGRKGNSGDETKTSY